MRWEAIMRDDNKWTILWTVTDGHIAFDTMTCAVKVQSRPWMDYTHRLRPPLIEIVFPFIGSKSLINILIDEISFCFSCSQPHVNGRLAQAIASLLTFVNWFQYIWLRDCGNLSTKIKIKRLPPDCSEFYFRQRFTLTNFSNFLFSRESRIFSFRLRFKKNKLQNKLV